MTDALIGIDIGTTAVKAGVISTGGGMLARFAAPYPTRRSSGGMVEQDPEDWVTLVLAALERFAGDGHADRVAAIGLCSQVNTHVFVDAAGRPVAPAMLWQDGRAAAEAAEIDAAIAEEDRLAWFGAPMPVDASHALPRMLWMARHRPDEWSRCAHVLLPKDYVLRRLTGTLASDPLSQIGLVGADLDYIAPLLGRMDGAAARMPPLVPATEAAGRVSSGPFAGRPVACGTMDAWAGLVGTGASRAGRASYLGGTSEILGVASPEVRNVPGAVVFPKAHGVRLHAAPTQSGGDAVQWFAGMQGIDLDAMGALAFRDRTADVPVMFLPQLQGERAPVWDANLRGGFVGVDRRTGLGDMAHAVFEGVAFAGRWAFETVRASAGASPDLVSCGGGGFRSDDWTQLRADVFGLAFHRVAAGEPGVLGAAAFAGIMSGAFADLAEASEALSGTGRIFEPDPDRHGRYTDRFEVYKQAVPPVGGIGAGLAGLGSSAHGPGEAAG